MFWFILVYRQFCKFYVDVDRVCRYHAAVGNKIKPEVEFRNFETAAYRAM